MANFRNTFFIMAGVLIGFGMLGWIGLEVQPHPFPPFPTQSQALHTVPLPSGLPAPVERFYKNLYGEEIPLIETAVLMGRGTLKPFMNIPVPARFVFVHNAGKDYRHTFEATLFGIPLLKVNEGYIDGASFFETPLASFTNNPKANQGANLSLWAEAIWFPSIWVTDPRVHWDAIDNNAALLYVPFENDEENFLVRFNPETGLIDTMETMRYRDTTGDPPKILWILQNEYRQSTSKGNGVSIGSAMWLDQGSPWAYFAVEDLIFNTDVSTFIGQKGY